MGPTWGRRSTTWKAWPCTRTRRRDDRDDDLGRQLQPLPAADGAAAVRASPATSGSGRRRLDALALDRADASTSPKRKKPGAMHRAFEIRQLIEAQAAGAAASWPALAMSRFSLRHCSDSSSLRAFLRKASRPPRCSTVFRALAAMRSLKAAAAFRSSASRDEIGTKLALRAVLGVAAQLAGHGQLARQFTTPRHNLMLLRRGRPGVRGRGKPQDCSSG